jgi:nicotinamidase-related amidase
MASTSFKPALIIVDFQNDFCPPNGSLAVPDGRTIASTINTLLSLPFTVKVATKDWHPKDHISFAANHEDKEPFTSTVVIANPLNKQETQETRLWPVHCVQGTKGAELVDELDMSKVTDVIEKGLDAKVEMYSAFSTPFSSPPYYSSGLADLLRGKGVSHCYVVGLAYDYCVKCTAVDAKREGFKTYVIREGTKAVDDSSIPQVEEDLATAGVKVIQMESEEIQRLSS